jgi:GH35 family endo-1,4-beta-xylanase
MMKKTTVVALLLATFGSLLGVGLSSCVGKKPEAKSAEPLGGVDMKEGNAKYGEVPGVQVLGAGGVRELKVDNDAKKVAISYVPVEGQPFKEALRAEIKQASGNPWDVQVHAMTTKPVERGDVLLATFYFRTEWAPQESGEGQTEFVFELAKDPWTKSVSFPVRASREWKKIHVPFAAAESYAPGEAHMIFRLGYTPEIIDIAGVTVENFGKKLAVTDLPVTRIGYAGSEPDAPWRKAAAERIEKLRKAELTVVVTDKAGKPVPGASVEIQQKKHAFGFGTCVPAEIILGGGNDKFKNLIPELFNVATLENDLKWQPLAGDWGAGFTVEKAKRAVAWLRERGLDVRGHVLVWPGWKNLPKYLKGYERQPDKLRAEVIKHIRELAPAMKGSLVHWDVLNEPFDNKDLMEILGQDVMVDWFKEARAADPGALLFINDYAILSGGGGTTPHRDHYDATIQLLLDKGAPVDAIGLQGHFGTSLTSPDDMLKILDRYGRFGKPIWITEYDVVMDDLETAGSFTRDFYTTLFSHPSVQGIVMWGFWDASHWKNNAALYKGDWTLKPGGQAYRDLVLRDWKTNLTLPTDAQGRLVTRGFLGDYEIKASSGGHAETVKQALGSRGASITIKL